MTAKVSCVYRIHNVRNGKSYIGSTNWFEGRVRTHKNHLIRDKHVNPILQAAWNKYGPAAFVFEIVELVPVPQLIEREQHYIELEKPQYNCKQVVEGALRNSHYQPPHSEATKQKIRQALLGRRRGTLSDDHKRNLSLALQGNTNRSKRRSNG